MPRIRQIKPELPEDEKLGSVPIEARYLFIALITMADDHGNLRGNASYVRSHAFPYDNLTIAKVQGWLDDLERISLILSYVVNDERYIHISNWDKHQVVKNPAKIYPIPGPPSGDQEQSYGDSTETLRRPSGDSTPRARASQPPASSLQPSASPPNPPHEGGDTAPERLTKREEGLRSGWELWDRMSGVDRRKLQDETMKAALRGSRWAQAKMNEINQRRSG